MSFDKSDLNFTRHLFVKLEFIAKLNQKCNEIAVCCDLYAPELQVTYKFNKIKSYNNNIYYIKKIR